MSRRFDKRPSDEKSAVQQTKKQKIDENQTSTSRAVATSSSKNNDQETIRKIINKKTILDSESEDEEMWENFTQTEKKILEEDKLQKSSTVNIPNSLSKAHKSSSSSFKTPAAPLHSADSNKENDNTQKNKRFLEQKCNALQIRINKMTETMRMEKVKMSEENARKNRELERLREEMREIENRNMTLSRNYLITGISQQPLESLRSENESLREQVKSLTQVNRSNTAQIPPTRSKSEIKLEDAQYDIVSHQLSKRFVCNPYSADILKYQLKAPQQIYKINSIKPTEPLKERLEELQSAINEFIPLKSAQRENFDTCWSIFQIIAKSICDLCECIKAEESTKSAEILTTTHFREKLVALFSKALNYYNNSDSSEITIKERLMPEFTEPDDNIELLGMEFKVHSSKIRLIGMIAVLARESCTLSKMLASIEIETVDNEDEKEERTLLEIIADSIRRYLVPRNNLLEYTGFAHGLATLGCTISRFYKQFDDKQNVIDESLHKFLTYVIGLSLPHPQTLTKITEFISNLGMIHDKNRLLPKLCKNLPSKETECNRKYQILQVPLYGCDLQILFMLILHAFPHYKDLPEHRVELLFQLTEKLNGLTSQIILNGSAMKFLHPENEMGSPKTCMCMYGLLSSLLQLHLLILEHVKVNYEKFKFKAQSLVRGFVISMDFLLDCAVTSNFFDEQPFIRRNLSVVYSKIIECNYSREYLYCTSEQNEKELTKALESMNLYKKTYREPGQSQNEDEKKNSNEFFKDCKEDFMDTFKDKQSEIFHKDILFNINN